MSKQIILIASIEAKRKTLYFGIARFCVQTARRDQNQVKIDIVLHVIFTINLFTIKTNNLKKVKILPLLINK